MTFDYSALLSPDLPLPSQRWRGFPKYNFIGGHNDGDSVPIHEFVKAAETVLFREGHTLATYGLESGPQGYLPLRKFIVGSLSKHAGMTLSADEVLLVSGSLQALDLVNKVFLVSGDTVIVEEATYQGALQRLDRLGVRYVGAPLDDGGIRMDALASILDDLRKEGVRPKYIYTVPTVQNPTGTIMTEERRLLLLEIAREFGVPIFEDDCYADLTFDGTRPRAIRTLDDQGSVIFCGSFSKTIAPALRVGFLVADWDILSRILSVKWDAGSGSLEQMVLAEYCANHFDDHVSTLRKVLKEKCDVIMESIAGEFGSVAEFSKPAGGIFIWVTLPEEVDTMHLSEAANAEGVAFNPGSEWAAAPENASNKMRLCFGNSSIQTIRDGVAKLAEICHRETGIPVRGRNANR